MSEPTCKPQGLLFSKIDQLNKQLYALDSIGGSIYNASLRIKPMVYIDEKLNDPVKIGETDSLNAQLDRSLEFLNEMIKRFNQVSTHLNEIV
jgi:hypothetical protein